ncbi:MAG: hypothetical protein AVDCRST_MAG10-3646, partial [uncultured Acidimicrobiales bacterium]
CFSDCSAATLRPSDMSSSQPASPAPVTIWIHRATGGSGTASPARDVHRNKEEH